MTRTLFALLLSLTTTAHAEPPSSPKPFEVAEASIAETQQALRDGRTTCHAIVEQYLARICRVRPDAARVPWSGSRAAQAQS
jgi:hypothetical protein